MIADERPLALQAAAHAGGVPSDLIVCLQETNKGQVNFPFDTPAWFPTHAKLSPADFEILQAPATGLTVLYRPADNLLLATDTGSAFAPPAR